MNWNKPVGGAVEIGDATKFRGKNQCTFEIVCPTVIRAAKVYRFSLGFRYDSRGVMAADVEEAAQNLVIASNDDDRLAGDITCEVVARIAQLSGMADKLPRARKDRFLLKIEY